MSQRGVRHIALLALAGAGALAGVVVLGSDLIIGSSTAAIISDSPKEVMDEAWQIVFRDYLDTTGKYTEDRGKPCARMCLIKARAIQKMPMKRFAACLPPWMIPTQDS